MGFKLLPCAPCDIDRVEEWINDEQKDGWRLKRFGLLLPFLASFTSDEVGGEYTISLEHTDEESERICVLRNVGYVVKGKPCGTFDESTLTAASRRVGGHFIRMVFPYILAMNFERMLTLGGGPRTILLVGFAACFLTLIGVGLYFLLLHVPAKSPRAVGLSLYVLGAAAVRVWLVLLIVRLITAIP